MGENRISSLIIYKPELLDLEPYEDLYEIDGKDYINLTLKKFLLNPERYKDAEEICFCQGKKKLPTKIEIISNTEIKDYLNSSLYVHWKDGKREIKTVIGNILYHETIPNSYYVHGWEVNLCEYWGFFSGSFNPPHLGHKNIVEKVCTCYGMKGAIMSVTPENPLKDKKILAPLEDRLEMTKLMMSDLSWVKVTDEEKRLPTPNYTYKSLKYFMKLGYKNLALIIGADQARDFRKWRNWSWILEHIAVIVCARPGYNNFEILPGMLVLPGEGDYCISSSMIRENISDYSRYLDPKVKSYIEKEKLWP